MLFNHAYTTSALSTSRSSSRPASPPPQIASTSRRRPSIPLSRRRLSNALTLALLVALPLSAYLAIDGILRTVHGRPVKANADWLRGARGERLKRGLREIGVGIDVIDVNGDAVAETSSRRARARSHSADLEGPPRWTTEGMADQGALLRRQEDLSGSASIASEQDEHAAGEEAAVSLADEHILHLDQQHIAWWGSADVVGRSPFDHIPGDHEPFLAINSRAKRRRKRILFLTDYQDYLERMNTNTYEVVDAALRNPDIDIDVWGPGWKYYNAHLPVSENVRLRAFKIVERPPTRSPSSPQDWLPWHPSWDLSRRIKQETRWAAGTPIEDQDRDEQAEEEDGGQAANVTGAATSPRTVRFIREADDWADNPIIRTLSSNRGDKEANGPPPQRWYPPNVYSYDRDRPAFWSHVGDDATPDTDMLPSWLGAGEGCADRPFDAVWTFSDIFKQDDPRLDAMGCGTVFIQQLGDCHSLNCLKEWYPQTNNITVTKYAFEMLDVFNYDRVSSLFPDWRMGLFGHSMDSANEWDFWPLAWEERKYDARVFGFDGSFYPLRSTVNRAIEDKQTTLVDRFEHPGYFIWADPSYYDQPLETYQLGHPVYDKHERTRADFARGMRASRICVFDASLERKMIRKYAQAMLSGCVIAGDLPTEHEDALSQFVIHLQPSWGIERIEAVLQEHLSQPEALKEKALLGFAFARKHLTNSRKVSDMLRLIDRFRAGGRGYDLPHGFSLRCRAYWSDDDSYRSPWCQGHRGLEE